MGYLSFSTSLSSGRSIEAPKMLRGPLSFLCVHISENTSIAHNIRALLCLLRDSVSETVSSQVLKAPLMLEGVDRVDQLIVNEVANNRIVLTGWNACCCVLEQFEHLLARDDCPMEFHLVLPALANTPNEESDFNPARRDALMDRYYNAASALRRGSVATMLNGRKVKMDSSDPSARIHFYSSLGKAIRPLTLSAESPSRTAV